MSNATFEHRSIYSGPIRRALENLQRQIATGGGALDVDGTWFGTNTPFPPNPDDGEMWLIGTPVPTVAPPNPAGGAAAPGDVIIWTGTEWINMGKATGPQGLPGPPGPPGQPGPPGVGIDEVWIGTNDPIVTYPTIELWYDSDASMPIPTTTLSYVHNQTQASTVWVIPHNLGWHPNVTVIDSAGSEVDGDITYTNTDQLLLTFSAGFTGVAYLS